MADEHDDLESLRPAGDALPEPEPPPPARRSPATLIALIIGVIAVVGGAVFAALAFSGDEGSPESAVEDLLAAVENEDLLGVLEALAPSERDALKGPIVDLADELKRLEILGDNLDLSGIQGIDIDFTDVKLSSQTLAEGIAAVKVDGGQVSTRADARDAPLGDFVRDVAGESLTEVEPVSESEDFTTDYPAIVTVKEDGRWRVSLWYSVAEAARHSAGAPAPKFGQGVRARGAASPEAAVEELLRAAAGLDPRRMIELLPPDEARALHDYAPLFLDEIEAELPEAREAVSVTIDALEVSARREGGEALVKVDDADFAVRFRDPEGETSESFAISYKDGCVRFEGRGGFLFGSEEPQEFCNSGTGFTGMATLPFGFGAIEPPELDLEQPDMGFRVLERDGAWYVSPTRTVLEALVATTRVFDRADLDVLVEWFGGIEEQMEAQFEEQMESGFESSGFTGDAAEIEACYEQAQTDEEYEACGPRTAGVLESIVPPAIEAPAYSSDEESEQLRPEE